MNEEYIAISIIFGWLALTAGIGAILTRKRFSKYSSVESWFVAGRSLGLIVLWLSLGANIYSAYTFLGLPGLAAREGVKAWGITLYGMISFLIGFIIIPVIWSHARKHRWLTIADAFEDLYDSKLLGAFVAITGALWSIPYIQLQIQGIGYIIETATYGHIDPLSAKLLAFTLIAVFTIVGGLMSVAFINMLQGAIMLISIWTIGILAPIIAFGGIDKLFNILSSYATSQPEGGVFRLTFTAKDLSWMITLIAVAPLAFWLWPNRVQNIFGARDVNTVKRNMVLVGIYQVSQIPAILVGLTAIALFATGALSIPVYKKPESDYAFMLVTRQLFPPWIVGLVGAGALAASISTAAAILHVVGALFSRNAYQRVFKPKASERELVMLARVFTAVIAVASLVLAIYAPGILIYLLLVGYAGIVQFFPAYVLGTWRKGLLTKYGALTGMAAGMLTVAIVKAFLGRPFGFYEGFWGLLVNVPLALLVSYIEKKLSRKQG